MNFTFLKYSKIYYILSGFLFLVSISFIIIFGLKFGIDFLGGTILEIEFENRPDNLIIQEKLKDLDLSEITIQPSGEKGVILRMKGIDETAHQEIIQRLDEVSETKELRFESIGPVIGRELRQKTIILVIVSLVALLLYIAISFRKVSKPLSSWQYGITSIVTLAFDIIITVGILALLGKLYNVQFSIPIVTALLTILGYTINDKVIVFDRVRENLIKSHHGLEFNALVDKSLNETFVRSLSTGSCTLLVLIFIFFFGGETLKYFSLTLIAGIMVGTYSSLFLASPLLVTWMRRREKP